MSELTLIEEQSIKATRFAHGILLTVCLAAFVFSFSPIEDSVYSKAVNEINTILSLNLSTLQVNAAKNNKEISDYYDQINLILKDYGFSFNADGSKKSILEVLPRPPYLEDFTLEQIYNYLNNTRELSVSIVEIKVLEADLRKDFSINMKRYSQWSKSVNMRISKDGINLEFGNTRTGIKLKDPIKDENIIKYKIPFNVLSEINKYPELRSLVTKYDETFILMDNLRRVWDQIRSEIPIQARAILARKDMPQDRRLEVFGLSIPQNLISWLIPVLVFAFGINLLTHILHLNSLALQNETILSYPWIGIMPGNLAKYVSAVTIVVFPFLSLLCIGKLLLRKQSFYIQAISVIFGFLSLICLIFVYVKTVKLKAIGRSIVKDTDS